MISENDFMSIYQPIQFGDTGDCALQTFEEAIAFAESRGLSPNHVWTVMESGDGDDDSWYVSAGSHLVNRLFYIVTQKPWETGVEDAVWFSVDCESEDDDAEDDENADLFQHQDELPPNVKTLITSYTRQLEEDEGDAYVTCRYFQKALELHGYTFDYGLDGVPSDLRRVCS
jgi:hypothetical protein